MVSLLLEKKSERDLIANILRAKQTQNEAIVYKVIILYKCPQIQSIASVGKSESSEICEK